MDINCKKIIDKFLNINSKLRIYIYDFYPSEFSSLTEFIDKTMENQNYNWGETYKSWLYFMNYLIKSPIYTNDPSIADLFLVPQWENLYKGSNYYRDLILPLKNAIESPYYLNSNPKRNHIFIYISDNTVLSEDRIPSDLRLEIQKRFICITYSGRITNFGKYHIKNQSDNIFNFDSLNEIVVPPGIPINCYSIKNPSKFNNNDIFYSGTLNPPDIQKERKDSLNYINNNININNKDNCYFGIHCAGYGIWTARFYNYLLTGIIPISFSDGVIMPFESFFNYKSFSLKILGSTCDNNDQNFVKSIKYACNICRKNSENELIINKDENNENYNKILKIQENIIELRDWVCKNNETEIYNKILKTQENINEVKDWFDYKNNETEIYDRIFKMQENIIEIRDWFDWKSKIQYKNPFTLIIIELYNRFINDYKPTENPIAKEEFYNFNIENLPLYK